MLNLMAALSNIGGTFCKSSVIAFLVPCRKLWLTPVLECRAVTYAANIVERKTWMQSEFCSWLEKFR